MEEAPAAAVTAAMLEIRGLEEAGIKEEEKVVRSKVLAHQSRERDGG